MAASVKKNIFGSQVWRISAFPKSKLHMRYMGSEKHRGRDEIQAASR